MNKLHSTLGFLFCLVFTVVQIPIASAQLGSGPPTGDTDFSVDSFFDVFYQIDIQEQVPVNLNCVVCDSILEEIKKKQAELDEQAKELKDAQNDLMENTSKLNQAKQDLKDARDALDEFDNPRSWVESEGRRTDSTDLQVMRNYNQGLWNQYKNGDLTAEELQDKWNEGLSDAEREKLKKEARKSLDKAVKDAQKKVDDLDKKQKEFQKKVDELKKKFEELLKELQELKKRYQDCLNRCKKEKVNIIDDFGLRIEERGLFDRIGDFFVDLFGEPEPIDIELVQLDLVGLEPGLPQPGDLIDTELIELDLTGGPGSLTGPGAPPVVDSFFDIFFDIDIGEPTVPPGLENIRCVICDPILQRIKAKEAELAALKAQMDQLLKDMQVNGKNLNGAKNDLQKAKDALDRFNNPRSWAESNGRRLDSSDLEAMREQNRRLWGQYRRGDLTAQELEQKWEEGLSDADRERIKDEIRQRLEAEVNNNQKRMDDLQKKQDDLEQKAKDLKQKIDDLLKELEELRKEYEDCLKKCVELDEEDLILIGDFFGDDLLDDLTQPPSDDEVAEEETGFFSGIVQWVVDIFKGDEKQECPKGTFTESGCSECYEKGYPGCSTTTTLDDGTECWVCSGTPQDFEKGCPKGTFPESECRKQCLDKDMACYMKLNTEEYGRECFACSEPDEPEECPKGTFLESGCSECYEKGYPGCSTTTTLDDGTECWVCSGTPQDFEKECPKDTFPEGECEKQCFENDRACYMKLTTEEYGRECFACSEPDLPPREECPKGTFEGIEHCSENCPSGECETVKTIDEPDGTRRYCLKCIEKDVPPPLEECPKGTFEGIEHCSENCPSGECETAKTIDEPDGTRRYCLKCIEKDVEPETCDLPAMDLWTCEDTCEEDGGNCVKSYTTDGGLKCYICEEPTVSDPECPQGTTSDQSSCQAQCDNGLCTVVETSGAPCWSCIKCPSGTSSNQSSCQSGCDGTCEVVASEGQLQCYQCKEVVSCEDLCAQNDYEVTQDYSSYILGVLNGYSCVSGANISIATATIGDCSCSRQPDISVDQTPPVCTGTPCGDVQCGQSDECTIGDTHYTVTCNWGGWEQIGENQFRPVVGGQ